MKLCLIRHASYLPKEVDPHEGLDEQGREDIQHLAKYLHRIGLRPDKIFHSPKERAKQTAHLLGFSCPSEETKALNPLAPPKETLETLPEDLSCIILVGHRPNLQEVSRLLNHDVPFETASCALFHDSVLEWYITPEITKIDSKKE